MVVQLITDYIPNLGSQRLKLFLSQAPVMFKLH